MRWSVLFVVLLACSKDKTDKPAAERATPAQPAEVSADQRARGAALIGELKKSLVGALTTAMGQGVPAAIAVCHTEAPALAEKVSREGAVVGRATRKPRNPKNEAAGWQAEALAHFEKLAADKTPLAGQSFARVLDGGKVAYAEPLVIQELCLACHGQTLAPEVTAVLAEKYPNDRATGYALGELRGVAWAELPAK
jgi:hypothetical protein